MYVSMYVCVCVVCVYMYTCICMYVCTYVCMYVFTYVCMYVRMYVCMYVHVHINITLLRYKCVCQYPFNMTIITYIYMYKTEAMLCSLFLRLQC